MVLFGNAIEGAIFVFNPVELKHLQKVILFTGNLQNMEKSLFLFVFFMRYCL